MPEQVLSQDEGIIEKILHQKAGNLKRIPPGKLLLFKAKIGEELRRSGNVREQYVDELLRQLRDGEL
jgi:hypothetical protein